MSRRNTSRLIRSLCIAAGIALPVAAPFARAELEIVVPAYFYPSAGSPWATMTAAADEIRITAIMNPGNGPGAAMDNKYVSAVDAFRAAGGRVIGYVYSSYGSRTLPTVLADIDRYDNWYAVDGIFVDEMANTGPAERLNYYKAIYDHVKTIDPNWEVMGNPGTTTIEQYITWPAADRLMVFENVGSSYPANTPSAWNFNYDSSRFVHLVHTEPSASNMTDDLVRAVERNAGGIYVTNDVLNNPWDTLPTFWQAEIAAAVAINASFPAGDFNENGVVAGNDLARWTDSYGESFSVGGTRTATPMVTSTSMETIFLPGKILLANQVCRRLPQSRRVRQATFRSPRQASSHSSQFSCIRPGGRTAMRTEGSQPKRGGAMLAAISYWSFERGLTNDHPIRDAVAQAREAGFGAIELAIGQKGVLTVTSSEEDCRKIRAEVELADLQLESLASGMTWECSPSHPDLSVRRRAIELHAAALQRAAWLGCRSLLFIPGAVSIPWDVDYPFVPYEQAIDWAREATGQLAKTAERLKVELCIENVWNGMFYSPLEYRDFIDSFSSEWVGAYFDAGNCMGQHQYPPHWIEILSSRIRRVHLKDFKRAVGNLDGFCDLLEGDQPWPETMAALRRVGYDRTLTAEMIPYAQGRVEKTARAVRQIMNAPATA